MPIKRCRRCCFSCNDISIRLGAGRVGEAIVKASALNNPGNAQGAPASRLARDIRVRWHVPLPLHLFGIRVTPQRTLQAVLNRMKREAE